MSIRGCWVDFPLGALFSLVVLLAAWGFANPDNVHLWIWNAFIAVGIVILVLGLGLYACIRSSNKLEPQCENKQPEDTHDSQVRRHTEPARCHGSKAATAKDTELGRENSVWNAAGNCFYKLMQYLKSFDSLITAVATILLTCATIGLALFAYWQWNALARTDETLNKTLINDNRAWISVQAISASGQVDGTKDIPIEIRVQNVGKSPALKVNKYFLGGTIPNPGKSGAQAISVGRNEACDGLHPDDGGMVFFQTSAVVSPYKTYTDIARKNILPTVRTNDGVLYLKGCFVYETMREVHHTWFCAVIYRNGQFASVNAWESCKDGQGAD